MDQCQIENAKRIILCSLSCVFTIGTDLHYALHLQQLMSFFLPLHVEKLLILHSGNVVVYCQSGIHYVGFLSCCCVALSSLLNLPESVISLQVCQSTTVTSTLIQKHSLWFRFTPLKASHFF